MDAADRIKFAPQLMITRNLLWFVFLFFVTAAPLFAQTTVTPSGWYPALSPSIRYALEQLQVANSTAEMNKLSRQVADMTDAQLYIAYVRLYERLGSKQRAALRTEQTKWLKEREKAASGKKADEGSLAPIEANNAELTYTEKRLRELRDRLKKIKSDDD